MRLDGHVLIEQRDESEAADRQYFSDNSMSLPDALPKEVATDAINAAYTSTTEPHGVAQPHVTAGRHSAAIASEG